MDHGDISWESISIAIILILDIEIITIINPFIFMYIIK